MAAADDDQHERVLLRKLAEKAGNVASGAGHPLEHGPVSDARLGADAHDVDAGVADLDHVRHERAERGIGGLR